VNYNDKLWKVKQFIEENFDDPTELTIALGLSVEDFINLLPDVLVANYNKFYQTNETDDTDYEEEQTDYGTGEDWEESA
jgi:hypothetical protein